MVIGIMQPYFFPYLPYFQLMKKTDRYVIYDDVQFIKSGWILRNRILINGKPSYIRVPAMGASSSRKINEVRTNLGARYQRKQRMKLSCAYSHAPYFGEVYPEITAMLEKEEENLADYLEGILISMASLLDIRTEFLRSSGLSIKETSPDGEVLKSRGAATGSPDQRSGADQEGMKGEERVLAVCKALGADQYVNASGGRVLYDKEHFAVKGVELSFLESEPLIYSQGKTPFQADLSIIDVLMWNGIDRTRKLLDRCSLTA